MLAMPVHVQNDYMNLLNVHDSKHRKTRSISNILDYAREYIGLSDVVVHVDSVDTCDHHPMCSHTICVEYDYKHAEPPTNAQLWTSLSSGRMFYTNSSGECFSMENTPCIFDMSVLSYRGTQKNTNSICSGKSTTQVFHCHGSCIGRMGTFGKTNRSLRTRRF